MELRAYLSYRRIKDSLTFWRSTHGDEVDFLVGDHTAIEVKSTKHVSSHHFKGLVILREEMVFKNFYMVSQDRVEKKQNGMILVHWENFLEKLWNDKLFKI
jgi:predicted AAA+ superfamily ATPase